MKRGHVKRNVQEDRSCPWSVGEAGPGPSYLDDDSGGPENDFTTRNLRFMTGFENPEHR